LFDTVAGQFSGWSGWRSSWKRRMDEAAATPSIERFLFNQVSGETISREMREIRKQAKIKYVGEFANRGAAAAKKGGKKGP